MLSKVKFKIADITFQFSSSYPKPILWIKDRYKTYIAEDTPDLDILLEFKKGYRKEGNLNGPAEVISENGKFFFKTEFFNARGNYSNGKVKVLSRYDVGVADLTRTLFSIIIVKRGGLLLHASAIADKTRSYVFCGPSESGKTTIARLLYKKDVLTDETTAIVNNHDRYYAYSTPFFGELGKVSKNIGAPIKAIFFIHKAKDFSHKRIDKAEAARYFLYNAILRGRNLDLTENILNNVAKLVDSVDCYDLYFKQDEDLWRYVNGIS